MVNKKRINRRYIICTSPKGNNASNFFFSLTKALISMGDEVVLVLDKGTPRTYDDMDCPIYIWPSYRPTKLVDFVFFFKLCKSIKPDVVLGQFGSTNVVLCVSKLLGIKNRMVYWHTAFSANRFNSQKISFKFNLYQARKKYIIKCCSTMVFTNSSATKHDLEREFKLKDKTIRVMPFLIEDVFKDKVLPASKRKNYIAIVARLQKSKGHEQFIKMIPGVLRLYPNLKIQIIGDGPERKHLEKQIVDLNLRAYVNFTGHLGIDEVYKYLKYAVVHISASLDEGFGLVNVEAIAAGTPIMAQKVGGITDILEHHYNGMFYDLNDEKSFTDGFQTIMDNWQMFSNNARHSFLNNFEDKTSNHQQRIQKIEPYLN